MAQQHLDRLSAVDAAFLAQEGPNSHMHIGGVVICEGPAPGFEEILDHIRGRLHLVPRYRQRLAMPPLDTGRPLWVDDPSFNLEYHIRQTALPAPGSERQLMRLVARLMSQRLDRSKPLWEMWIVEGLEDGRFAVISKTHHSLTDGIAGVDLATVIFDFSPNPGEVPHSGEPWRARRAPGAAQLMVGGTVGMARTVAGGLVSMVAALAHPTAALRTAGEAAEGIGEVVKAGLSPAPPTPLNVPIGPYRRYAVVRHRLDDFKAVKNAFGGTVNDVVLTVVTGALREWLHGRGVRTDGLELRALVPVSTRSDVHQGQLGNRITVMRGPLPVHIDDPIARLRAVKTAMDGLKESKQAVGAEMLTGVQSFAPPTVLAQASRINFSTRLFNLIVTNVPGPQVPIYVRGREMTDVFPVAFLPKDHALAIAIMSYHGHMNFGLLADYDAVADLDVIAEGIEGSLDELVTLARRRTDPPRQASNGIASGGPTRATRRRRTANNG